MNTTYERTPMTEYALSIESERTELAAGMTRLDLWVSMAMGFEDPGMFLLHRRRSLVNKDATPGFETFANPCTLVEYPYRAVERNHGLYRDRGVSLTFGPDEDVDTFLEDIEDRRSKLVGFMNAMSSSLDSAMPEQIKGVELKASRDDLPFMMIEAAAVDGSSPFVFEIDKTGFSRFIGLDGEGIRKGSLEVVAYSTRAPMFLDFLRTDLRNRKV